ncbi:unnamed protein product [Trichogramma brassicae]|uniref:Uncharacterized protein n=1 Tax=Trichogramma brassicae TaxID=86971 RepID=A0A6H5IM50_9HYME|nr:uncharacterized protein LOC106654427 [Trichogramma pretiosum]CAB0038320.1 unnamed protein product [Trichogramma brassicae]
MWYETLPPLLIIGVLMTTYQVNSVLVTKLLMGVPYRREIDDVFQRVMWTRDTRVSGVPWRLAGLENIPDETPKKQ